MAKLSAYGQHEVARFTKEWVPAEDDLVIRREKTFAVMSNGRVLSRSVVTFRGSTAPDAFDYQRKSERHDYGWKVSLPAGKRDVAAIAKQLLEKGYHAVPHRGRYGLEPAYQLPFVAGDRVRHAASGWTGRVLEAPPSAAGYLKVAWDLEGYDCVIHSSKLERSAS